MREGKDGREVEVRDTCPLMCNIIIGHMLILTKPTWYIVMHYVLNGLLIFHSEVDGSNLLPSPFVLGWLCHFARSYVGAI